MQNARATGFFEKVLFLYLVQRYLFVRTDRACGLLFQSRMMTAHYQVMKTKHTKRNCVLGERQGRAFWVFTSHDCKEQRAKLLDWAGRLAWPVGAQTFAWSRQRSTEVANEGDSHRVTES